MLLKGQFTYIFNSVAIYMLFQTSMGFFLLWNIETLLQFFFVPKKTSLKNYLFIYLFFNFM